MGEGLRGVKEGKGLGSTNGWLPRRDGVVKYGVRNIVDNVVITMYDVRRVPDLSGRSLPTL